jgi:hypothetical protein
VVPSKLTLVLTAVLMMSAACSSSRQGSAHSVTTRARAATPSTTTRRLPTLVSISASREPWTLVSAVSRPVVLPSGRDFVVLGGLTTGDESTAAIVEVDPNTGASRTPGHLGVAVHDSAGAVIGNRFFVFGGGSFDTVSLVQASSGGSATDAARLPEARSDLSAAALNGTTYIVGGFDGTAMTPAILATTDGVSFRPVAQLAIPVRYAAVAGVGGALWVVGGVTSTAEGGTAETDAVQKVDLLSGRVTITSRLPQPIGHATALILDGQMFVLGGRSGTTPSAVIYRLDPASGTLEAAGQLPGPVSDAGSVVVGDVGYLVGGEVTGPVNPLDTVVALRPRLQPSP